MTEDLYILHHLKNFFLKYRFLLTNMNFITSIHSESLSQLKQHLFFTQIIAGKIVYIFSETLYNLTILPAFISKNKDLSYKGMKYIFVSSQFFIKILHKKLLKNMTLLFDVSGNIKIDQDFLDFRDGRKMP